MSRVTRNPKLPKIRIPVLYMDSAMEEFERAVQQPPEWGDEVVDGYIQAEIYWNRRETWQVLLRLQERGIVWMPDEVVEQSIQLSKLRVVE